MKIIEHIRTIQGEGRRSGEVCDLIRIAGCNLRCSFCDTKHSWNENPKSYISLYTEKDMNEFSKSISPNSSVVITGGEPLQLDNLEKISKFYKILEDNGCHITFETNGIVKTNYVTNIMRRNNINFVTEIFKSLFPNALYSISPKLNPSFYNLQYSITTDDLITYYKLLAFYLKEIGLDFYYKFVYMYQDRYTIGKILNNDIETYIMPHTTIGKQWDKDLYNESCEKTVNYCISMNNNGYNVIYSPRIHINIWGPVKGK